MAEIIRKYSKKECEDLREEMIWGIVIPYLKAVFKEYDEFNSAAFMVAQYWDDEASDAVHCDFVFSVQDRPDISASIEYHKALNDDNYDTLGDEINHPDYSEDNMFEISQTSIGIVYKWDDNRMAIPAFAAFTKEGADQCSDLHDNYSPYAFFFKKDSGELDYEVVGKMHRPWLDGVCPEYDRLR